MKVGKIYRGCRVSQVMPFGAFVEVRLAKASCRGGMMGVVCLL